MRGRRLQEQPRGHLRLHALYLSGGAEILQGRARQLVLRRRSGRLQGRRVELLRQLPAGDLQVRQAILSQRLLPVGGMQDQLGRQLRLPGALAKLEPSLPNGRGGRPDEISAGRAHEESD